MEELKQDLLTYVTGVAMECKEPPSMAIQILAELQGIDVDAIVKEAIAADDKFSGKKKFKIDPTTRGCMRQAWY